MEKTRTAKVAKVQFNYVQFLWARIAEITQMEQDGQYFLGLQTLIDLLNVVPRDIYMKFKDRASLIQRSIGILRLKVKEQAIDWLDGYVRERRLLNRYAKFELAKLKRELCSELDKRKGYMEVRVKTTTDDGFSHTWVEQT